MRWGRAAVWAKRAALAFLALAALYLAAANLLLSTDWGERLLSPRPERFHIAWRSGWTLWPGRVQLRGVSLGGASPKTTWTVTLERAAVAVDLSDLFSRTVRLTRLDAEGVSLVTTRREPAPLPPRRPRRRPWTIVCERARVSTVRALEIHGLRLAGKGHAEGGFRIVAGRTFELFESSLELDQAKARSKAREWGKDLAIAVRAKIAAYEVRKHRGAAVFDFVSGSLSAAGTLSSLPLEGAATGRLAAQVQLADGVLERPSRITVTGTGLEARLAVEEHLVLTGTADALRLGRFKVAHLAGSAETAERRLSRLLAEARAWRGGTAAPLACRFEGREIEVAAPPGSSWSLAAKAASGHADLTALLRRRLLLATVEAQGVAAAWNGWHLDGELTGKDIDARLAPQALEEISGSLALSARVTAPKWLTQTVPESRRSSLTADLRLVHGTVAPGSRAALALGSRLTASALADAAGLALRAQGRGLTLAGPTVTVASRTASLSSRTNELRLTRLASPSGESGLSGLPPADLDAREIVWKGTSERLAHRTEIEHATARLDLAALARREMVLSGFAGSGLSVQLDLLREPAAGARPPARWSLSIPEARLGPIREVALGDLRLVGPATARLSLASSPAKGLSLTKASLALPRGTVLQRGETLADPLSLSAQLELAPVILAGSDAKEILHHLQATCEVAGQVSSLAFLERYVKRPRLLDLAGGGTLHARVELDRGRLAAGSRVEVTGADVRAAYLDHVASGSARITGRVEAGPREDTARVAVVFDRFTIAPAGGGQAVVTGRGLTLSAVSPDVDLTQPVRALTAEVVLDEGEVGDLAVYNRYLPEGIGVGIVSGRGKVGFRLRLDPIARTGKGEVKLQAREVTARLAELELAGDLAVHAALDSRDLLARRFDLAGSRLSLSGMTVHGTDDERPLVEPGWWAQLDFERGDAVWSSPLALSASARLTMRDPSLLVALFATKRATLGWLLGILNVENVTAQGEVRLADGLLSIDPLHATAGKLDLRSRLEFAAGRRSGDLLVRWGRLAAGIELRDGERTWKLRRPEEWFEKSRLGPPEGQ